MFPKMVPRNQSFLLPALAFLAILQLVPQGTSEIAYVSSVASRKVLVGAEQRFVEALHNYSQLLETEFRAILGYLSHLNGESQERTPRNSSEFNYSNDPLNEYFKLQRIVETVEAFDSQISKAQAATADLKHLLLQARTEAAIPSTAERQLSLQSLLHLVRTFELDPNELAAGFIKSLNTTSGLSALNCLEIGTFAVQEGLYRQAIEFLEEGKKLLDSSIRSNECMTDCSELSKLFDQVLADAVSTHDLNLQTVLDAKGHSKVFKSHLNSAASPEYTSRTAWDLPLYYYELTSEGSIYVPEMFHNHEQLCREEVSKPLFERHQDHKCFLLSQSNNFLSPAKIQVLHRDPLIFQVYDAISEAESQKIIQAASPSLFRSPVLGKPGAEDRAAVEREIKLAFHRSSQSTWIVDQRMSPDFKIERAVLNVINVELGKVLSAENSQVANYASGGQYIPHPDSMFIPEYLEHASEDDKMAGDRLITFMIYLNNVTLGGGTAFPFLGVVAKPEPRSALVWFNLKADMDDRDLLTVHGGCPVLYGDKWIANKWIRAYNQMFLIPCPRDLRHREYFYSRYFNS